MPCVGLEPTIPASERAKIVHDLDLSAIVTGVFNIHVNCLSVMLAVPYDDDQQWPKHVKVIFYILILNLLHLMGLTTHSCLM
jgi:hypothetical protein